MKKSARRTAPLAAALVLLCAPLFCPHSVSAAAASVSDRAFAIEAFDVEMNVGENRVIETVEELSVVFSMPRSGVIRDFPMEAGTRYSDIRVLRDGEPVYHRYESYSDGEGAVFSLYIGDANVTLQTGRTYRYTISYTMTVSALPEEGYLPIDVVGFGWQAAISDFTARLTLPEGLTGYEVYTALGEAGDEVGVAVQREGNTLLLSAESLTYGGYTHGVTLDMKFAPGVLKAPPADLTPLWAVLVMGGVFLVFALLKFLLCRSPAIVRTVNFTAPEEMDPLRMGKVIDGKIDPEDLGSLVFWLASEGYLTIDLSEDRDDPVLTATEKPLSADLPSYIGVFYSGLFAARRRVHTSELKNSFYTTADSVKAAVDAGTGALYSVKGKVAVAILALFAVLLTGGFAFLYTLCTLNGYYYFAQLLLGACSFALPAVFSCIAERNRFKWKRAKRILFAAGGTALGCLPALLFLLLPSPALGVWAHLILTFAAAAAGGLAGELLVRTEKYCDQLGHILGFKDFILYTERDKLEFMLKEDPELYYNILPYAQVLGLTDAWTEKFEGLDLKPPRYLYYNSDLVFDLVVWRTTFVHFSSGMARSMVSRPSTSGNGGRWGGGMGGGFGGGFGGGGFGGGGGRSF